MTVPGITPPLADEQRALLQIVFDQFLRTGRWPTFAYLDDELFETGVDVGDVVRSLPRGVFHPDRRGQGGLLPDEADEVSLTVRGVACCRNSDRVLDRFVHAIRWGVAERRRTRAQSPDEVPDPTWRFGDVVGAVRLSPHGSIPLYEVTIVLRLMEHEPYLLRWGGPPNDPQAWTIKIPREIRRYAGVESLADYFAVAHPAAEGPVEAPPANPFVFPVEHPAETTTHDLAHLHEAIRRVAGALYTGGHYDSAIFAAFKAVNNRVKKLTALDEDGQKLMAKAFNPERPLLRFNEGVSQTDQDEQRGLMHIFMGAMGALRNPRAHADDLDTQQQEALEQLGLASLLMRRLDDVGPEGSDR